MGLPNINITFSTLAETVSLRGSKGTVALILSDTAGAGSYTITGKEDIPAALSADNKSCVLRALVGGENPPDKVLLKVLSSTENLEDGLAWAALQEFDYLCGPMTLDGSGAKTIADWITEQRAEGRKAKAVLPGYAADSEGVVNFTGSGIKTAEGTFTAAQYCSRIAGLIAGTPFEQSVTFAPLPEVLDADRLSRADADAAVDAGKLILCWDGQKFKLGRGVNSLVTTTDGRGRAFQKIKIVEIMDLIRDDITRTANDQFVGRYANSYDNRCLLLSAIRGYFDELAADGLISPVFSVELDLEANRSWCKANNVDTAALTDEQIRRWDTGSVVNLRATLQILDAIEDISLPIQLNQ